MERELMDGEKQFKVLLKEIRSHKKKWKLFAIANPEKIRKNRERLILSSRMEHDSVYKLHPETK